MLLNRENIVGIATISVGGLRGTMLDPKMIFSIALKASDSALVLVHNHPNANGDESKICKVNRNEM